MISYTVVNDAYTGRKICRTCAAVRVEKEKGMVHTLQPASGQCPVCNVVMFLSGSHVVDILGIILTAYSFTHADKLLGMNSSHKST